MLKKDFKEAALEYHAKSPPGKIGISITKPTDTQYDLSLAYTPGVAEPVEEIASDPSKAYLYTGKGNLVAVISNGTAVLGLGDVGPLASKPVMEGKAAIFKRFANIDVFDIEIDADDPKEFINVVARIAPTFGAINLEDIKAPECFEIETELQKRLKIPVFHDDQHGTAIVVAAGLLNALELQKKQLAQVKIVCVGAGSAGIASLNLLVTLGAKKENVFLLDTKGVVRKDRNDLNQYKIPYAQDTKLKTLEQAMVGADVFIGVAKPDLVTPEMIASMAKGPIVFALSNPDPEIKPEIAKQVRKDLIIATGRSDYPNQVNNALCFPFIFRGALDVRATSINKEMFKAAVESIRKIAHEPVSASVLKAYEGLTSLEFGPEYIIPKPMDPRLAIVVPKAVSQAAIHSGVATRINNIQK